MLARLSLPLFVALTLPSCTLALAYPPDGVELCDGMGQDEDRDGLRDCADPDCDGQCVESDPMLCRDGRDNDLDGLRDQEDLGCLPYLHATVERCESVRASSWTQTFDTFSTGWSGASGTVMLVPDPDDASHQVVQLVGSPSEHAQIIGPIVAGNLEGATIDFEYQTDDTTTAVGVLVDGADLRAPIPDGLFVGTQMGNAFLAGSSQAVGLFTTDPTGRWLSGHIALHHAGGMAPTLDLVFDGHTFGAPDFRMLPSWFLGIEPGVLPAAIADGVALRPAFATFGTAILRRYAIELPALDPCSLPTAADPHPTPMPVPQVADTILGIAMNGASVCALAVTPPGVLPAELHAWRSSDGGRHFDRDAVVVASSTTEHVGAAPMIVEDGSFAAAVAWYVHSDLTGMDTTAEIELVRSSDCTTWTRAAHPELAMSRVHPHALGFSADADGHEIALVLYPPADGQPASLALVHDQGGDTFDTDSGHIPFPASVVLLDGFAGMSFLRAGPDRAVLFASDRAITGIVRIGAESLWRPIGDPWLEPSHRVGTFDELLVSSPAVAFAPIDPMAERPSRAGILAFASASSCPAANCDGPSAVASFSLDP